MTRHLLAILFLVGCTAEPIDPMGLWSMQLSYQPGDCNQTSATIELLIDQERITSADVTVDVAGSMLIEESQATLTAQVRDPDVFSDGGSVQQIDTLTAILDETGQISGFGQTNVSGLIVCSQPFAITGRLQ